MNQHHNRFTPDDFDDETTSRMFQGMQHDPAQAQFYDRPRAFDPQVQRWANVEPAAYVDGMNWYNAPPDNPINTINPLGA